MEIYNESVRDLLSSDTAPLRLLDDPEVSSLLNVPTSIFIFQILMVHYFNREELLLRNSLRKL